jgi:RNA polymerase sigma-70 factor (ECF subfamily)
MDDRDLVRRMLCGEERAFDEFFDQNFDRVFRFAARRLDDRAAAEDVAQATLARAMAKLHTWKGEAALFTWLCAICRREVMAWTARNGRVARAVIEDESAIAALLDGMASTDESPEDTAARHELAALIQGVLDHLPHRYGDILEWKYLLDWSVSRVADQLGVSEKAAESMLTRAREAFRRGFASLSGAMESES